MIQQLLVQSPDSPSDTARALLAQIQDSGLTRMRATVAYATVPGVSLLIDATSRRPDMTVHIVVGLDGAVTEPNALRALRTAYGANARAWQSSEQGSIFHAKCYGFDDSDNGTRAVIITGSANLTASGLGRNREVSLLVAGDASEMAEVIDQFDGWWSQIWESGSEITDELLIEYEVLFAQHHRPIAQGDRLVTVDTPEVSEPVRLAVAGAATLVLDTQITGGGSTQLELPKAVVPFFEVDPADQSAVRYLSLHRFGHIYTNNVMTFYASNDMWRINIDSSIPDVDTGLSGETVLFARRTEQNHYQFTVLSGPERAVSLALASRAGNLGHTITREYGWY